MEKDFFYFFIRNYSFFFEFFKLTGRDNYPIGNLEGEIKRPFVHTEGFEPHT